MIQLCDVYDAVLDENNILCSSTAISVDLYTPAIVQRYWFYTTSSWHSLVLLISLGFVHSSGKYQVLHPYEIASQTTAKYIVFTFWKEAPHIEAVSWVSAAI